MSDTSENSASEYQGKNPERTLWRMVRRGGRLVRVRADDSIEGKSPETASSSLETPLTDGAHQEAASLVAQYERNLKDVARLIASEQAADTVIVPHIKDAHASLRKWGLGPEPNPPDWWNKPDNQAAIGGVVLGLAPTIGYIAKDVISADGSSLFADHPWSAAAFVVLIPVLIGAVGMAALFNGLANNK